MKKFLVILTLALALCLACSSALAYDYLGRVNGTKDTIMAELAKAATDFGLTGTPTYEPAEKAIKALAHGEETIVLVTGKKDGKTITTEALVTINHSFADKNVDETASKDPTCTEKGVVVYICDDDDDGHSEPVELPALGHSWVEQDSSTCKKAGKITYVCQRCGETKKGADGKIEEKDAAAPKAHDFKAVIISMPKCEWKDGKTFDLVNGTYKYACSMCGLVIKDASDPEYTAAMGSEISGCSGTLADGVVTVGGSNDTDKIANFKKVFADAIPDGYDGHTWDAWQDEKAPDCDNPATHDRWCKVCGKWQHDAVKDSKPLEAIWVLKTPASCKDATLTMICSICNSKSANHPEQTLTPADMPDDEYQVIPGKTVSYTDPTSGKTFTAEVLHNWKQQSGTKVEYRSGSKVVNKLSDFTKEELKQWCVAGTTETKLECSVCGATDTRIVKSQGHDWTEWKVSVIKDEKGTETSRWVSYCKVCDDLRSKPLDTKPVDPCKPGEHVFDKYKNPEKLECEKDYTGVVAICSVCGEEFTLTDTVNIKHAWKDVSVIEDATCTKAGSKIQKCTNEGCTVKLQIVEIPVKAHNIVEIAETPATCAATGLKAAYKCDVCGKLFSDKEGKTEITAQEVIPATGEHTWNDGEVVTTATCTKEGKKLITCTVCGLTKTEAIEKIAHTPVEVAEVPATCKDTGVKAGKKCSVCGEELEGFEVIPADETAHVWEEEVLKAATCKEAGVALKTCSVCGKVEKVEIEKLAHTWDEGKITKEATKEAKGEKTYTCTACGETKTEEVEYVVTAAPKYSVTGLTYDNQTLKGKLAHDEDTLEAETLNVRVTFFMTGNYYMATIGEVAADGSFSVDGVGPIEYISVVATGSSSVNPDDVVALGSGEITVK